MLDGVFFYEPVLHPPAEQQGQDSANIVGETKLVRSLGFVADLHTKPRVNFCSAVSSIG